MVDGNMDHCISMPINTMMQCIRTVTKAIEKENTRDQREAKNSYVSYNRIHINTDVFCIYTTKSVVPFKKDYKIL